MVMAAASVLYGISAVAGFSVVPGYASLLARDYVP
jgi:hypothetical protein